MRNNNILVYSQLLESSDVRQKNKIKYKFLRNYDGQKIVAAVLQVLAQ